MSQLCVLNTDSIYKQGNNYHPQVYVEDECKYADAEKQQRKILRDYDDDGFFEV